jgi:phage-related protein
VPRTRRWRFYTTAAGRNPVREFLADARLPVGDRDEILAAMKDVQANGLGVARHLQSELYEVRADGRQATYRVLFATEGASSQILLGLSAFSKKTQKTPAPRDRPRRAASARLAKPSHSAGTTVTQI